METDFEGGGEIRFERRGRAGLVILTRPKSLNALNHRMVRALARALEEWAADPAVAVVAIRAEGPVFCSGGDIVEVYRARQEGSPPVDFFADEYRLNARIADYPKPYVALIDGLAMGGGVGVSYHGSHRVATQNAVFAMPETGIGFLPDIGASHLLSRLRGAFGMYLGLTGSRIRQGDQLWSGLATHAVEAERLEAIADALAETGDPDEALAGFALNPARETDDAALLAINRHFSLGSVEAIIASLQEDAAADPFAEAALQALTAKSPTSLKVALAQIDAGGALTMEECMRMEFRIVNRMLAGHDFYEGIRAAMIDRDRRPRWRPATLAEVDDALIDAYFAPLGEGELWP